MFRKENYSTSLNIYLHKDSELFNDIMTGHYMFGSYMNPQTSWTNNNGNYYNAGYNVYLYPVANVQKIQCENESDIILSMHLGNLSDNINIDESGTAEIISEYYIPAESIDIDYGSCFTIPLYDELFQNKIIEKVEVIYEL